MTLKPAGNEGPFLNKRSDTVPVDMLPELSLPLAAELRKGWYLDRYP
jgi:hypothetical protein